MMIVRVNCFKNDDDDDDRIRNGKETRDEREKRYKRMYFPLIQTAKKNRRKKCFLSFSAGRLMFLIFVSSFLLSFLIRWFVMKIFAY